MRDFLGYGRQFIDDEDKKSVLSVLESDFLTQGPKVAEFEKKICDITGARFAVAVSNGTAALHIAVKALGICDGCEGITTPNTFLATANSIVYNNLVPVFADIEPDTFNIDPDKIRENLTERTALLIPVHFAGQPARMKEISEIAIENGLAVIEDACHAIGSFYEDGTAVGSCRYSDMTVFSFHPVKTVTTGEGGVITTNDEELYERLLRLRNHGMTKDSSILSENPGPWYYEMVDLGFNYRMTDLQAALGVTQLDKLEWFKKRRREIVRRYNYLLKDVDWIKVPVERDGVDSSFHLYVILVDFEKIAANRKVVMETLAQRRIGTQVHYIPVHLQPYYRDNFGTGKGDCPVAESYYERTLSIPLFPSMTDEDVEYVVETLRGLNG